MALSITAGDGDVGSQANTQSPQTSAGSGSPASAPAGSVQPGTSTGLLTQSSGGVTLNNQVLTTVSLAGSSTQTAQASQAAQTPPPKHHINPVLLGLAIILFVLAIFFMWTTSRSEKNTTH